MSALTPAVMTLIEMWLLTRHPDLDDAETGRVAQALHARVMPLPIDAPIVPLLDGFFRDAQR